MMSAFRGIFMLDRKTSGVFSHNFNSKMGYCTKSVVNSNKIVLPKKDIFNGPGLDHFISNTANSISSKLSKRELEKLSHPYVDVQDVQGHGRRVYFEVYGCQMNVSDVEVAWSILEDHGYCKAKELEDADVVLIMTCAIRDGAEQKIWNKLEYLKGIRTKRFKNHNRSIFKIGILGCMAERLKQKLIEREKCIDVVVGPDGYRDLPRLLAIADGGQSAVNVLLSLEETYADIVPVSLSQNRISAFVSIMRGCDNMCTYCIVPFTRGRERSRPISSILDEVRRLSDEGVKEITLLGQNVNSYCDASTIKLIPNSSANTNQLVKGFHTLYKPKVSGLRFSDLLDQISLIDPEIRIRFTSPHPKDFPDEVLHLIQERNNICKSIHLPAQSGNSRILQLMRRGYTKEAYVDLVHHIRSIIPDVSLTSDFICGFCSETNDEFEDTLALLQEVQYSFCYLFPYSLRQKTPAHRQLKDDIPHDVKIERLNRMVKVFREELHKLNISQIGEHQLVLVEGFSKRSESELVGRNNGCTKVIFPCVELEDNANITSVKPGNYIEVIITDATSQVLKAVPLTVTSLKEFNNKKNVQNEKKHAMC